MSGRRNVVIQDPLWQLLPKAIVRASEYEGKLFNQSSYLRRALLNQLRADGVDTGRCAGGAERCGAGGEQSARKDGAP